MSGAGRRGRRSRRTPPTTTACAGDSSPTTTPSTARCPRRSSAWQPVTSAVCWIWVPAPACSALLSPRRFRRRRSSCSTPPSAMLARRAGAAGRHGCSAVHVADMAGALPEGPFDAVVSALAIHHLEHADKRASDGPGARRALRPGGVFANAEQVDGPTAELSTIYTQRWADDCRVLGATDEEIDGARERDAPRPLRRRRDPARVAARRRLRHGRLHLQVLAVRRPRSRREGELRAMAGTRDWDAGTYDRISAPQQRWAAEQLDRLRAGRRRGRGRRRLRHRQDHADARRAASRADPCTPSTPRRRWSRHTQEALGDRATALCQDLAELALPEPVDVVFSNATFTGSPITTRCSPRWRAT